MKNIANADRPKSVGAMLPPRPFLGSGKVAQTACNSDRREGKSCIPTVNQTFADSRILKISKFRAFRIADSGSRSDRWPVAGDGPGAQPSPRDGDSNPEACLLGLPTEGRGTRSSPGRDPF